MNSPSQRSRSYPETKTSTSETVGTPRRSKVLIVEAGDNLYQLAKRIHEVGLDAYLDRPGPWRKEN